MKGKLLLLLLPVLLAASPAVNCKSDGIEKWQILTKQNFSSEIRLHPHILLLVTVPWCGESRSIMREVGHLVTARAEEYGSLKLMFMHRNAEKMLANAIGAIEKITILYYHHSLSYKYRGKLRAQNILYSLHSYLPVLPDEVPLIKTLRTPQDLNIFLESTDKALLLLEFCGWTPVLMAEGKSNGTKMGFGMQGDSSGSSFSGEMDGKMTPRGKSNQQKQAMEDAKLHCDMKDSSRGIPWFGECSSINDTDTFQETEDKPGVGLSCTFEEFQKFSSFFPGFMTVAREFFLPPERLRFGLVSERSLVSSLGLHDANSWLVMVYLSGCPSCSKILKPEDDIRSVLQMHNPILRELDIDGVEPAVPGNKASMILFVDRSSDSSETRRKSKEVLDAFKELALDYQMEQDQIDKPEMSFVKAYQEASGFKRPIITGKKILKERMSIKIIEDGRKVDLNNIASDLQGNSLQEILELLLQKKKKAKLSSVAKELGFQLLSDDLDIKVTDILPSQKGVQAYETSSVLPEESLDRDVFAEKDQFPDAESASVPGNEERSQSSSQQDEEKMTYDDTSLELLSTKSERLVSDHGFVKAGSGGSSQEDESGRHQHQFQKFEGSFFFCDGNDRLLRALTGGLKIPSVVIIDPILQQHYAFPKETILSNSSLVDFLNGFLNGSLIPYQRSEIINDRPRKATVPPFVNLDFHEVDPIPRVTIDTFSELVIGVNQSYNENTPDAWNKDVLVLFSNSWCGFCQRMEWVVREVYRAVKGYTTCLKSESSAGPKVLSGENSKTVLAKLPSIYLMDCTLNDCSVILKSIDRHEVYPVVVLFPAQSKTAISYEGDNTVADVIKFIGAHATNAHHLIGEKGILRTVADRGGRQQNLFADLSPAALHGEANFAKDKFHEVLLKTRTPKRDLEQKSFKPQTANGMHETAPHVVVGSMLIATEKVTVQPFDNSIILIVKADQNTGFQGVIINKHISWDSLRQLEEGLDILKKAPLSFGGPLAEYGKPLVALIKRGGVMQHPEVEPGIHFLDQKATISEMEELRYGRQPITDYWFFLGYSSWGWEQLFKEIAEGAWSLNDKSAAELNWPHN
ncbi:hypothetical protein HS088_TW03G00224 [Tripterygium wilfordii]|uniref:Thioredoxin domain-containing protein n=1 Tax=Tripterygium wilfordii TaxID=458696 RepID=A0A7J7DUA6_TRIWF|nr:uncharacterized protein LOC119991781 isoform X2 [Tripterygium wilfordii]KAF5749897.1 hypothetical protein HS088_TW03G00224 [Tripterygium wilfordii]